MGHIHILSDEVINHIAAGEVVERPASVVKELVENALDAGANEIKIDLYEGGIKKIVITDNGSGLDRDDLELSIKRHATSKIKTEEDLFKIQSFGFRGEALAAISSVSQFSILTNTGKSSEGYRLTMSENLPQIISWNASKGTTVVVEDLFYNVPARQKFLKSPSSEWSHVLEILEGIAIVRTDVTFKLTHNGKVVWEVLRCDSSKNWDEVIQERIEDLYPNLSSIGLLKIDEKSNKGNVRGFISPPGQDRNTGKWIKMFVNGRMVQDKNLRFGILRGYHSHLLKGRYPMAFIFMECPPALLDVNVHPAKTEVRFQFANDVQELIASAIRKELRKGNWVNPNIETYSPPIINQVQNKIENYPIPPTIASPVKPASFSWDFDIMTQPPQNLKVSTQSFTQVDKGIIYPWHEMEILGSLAQCYLFLSWQEKLLVIDQHAFHERILYEKFLKQKNLFDLSQPLQIPDVVELNLSQASVINNLIPDLVQFGIGVKKMSDTTFEIVSIPELLKNKSMQKFFEEISSGMELNRENIHHDLLATMACHSAVRAGEDLPKSQIQALLKEADQVDFFHNCPHGRRVIRVFEKNEIGRWFDRL